MKHFYICYSEVDKPYLLRLKQRLNFFANRDRLSFWSQESLFPGEVIQRSIDQNMAKADVILMLVSSDFFDYQGNRANEYQLAVERGAAGLSLIVPVILRSTFGWQESEIGIYPPARNGRPISQAPDQDEAWSEVIAWIEKIFTAVDQTPQIAGHLQVTQQEMLIKIATDVENILAGQKRMEDGISQLIQLSAAQKAEIAQVIQLIDENRFSEGQMIEALQLIDEFVKLHVHQLSAEVRAQFEAMKTKDLEVQKRFKWSIPIIPLILTYELDIQDNSKQKSANGFWKALKQGRMML